MTSRKICILLTGTIYPDQVFSLGRTDPIQREADYYHALTQWLKKGFPVIFCENSNYKSARIDQMQADHAGFEFLQYKETTDLSKKGKGLGEFSIMAYAHANSQIIKESDYVIKITGRLFVRNFEKIMRKLSAMEPDVVAPLELKLKWADSRMFIYKKFFFEDYFSKYGNQIDDSTRFVFERALACSIHAALADNKKWEPLPCYPVYEGYSGTFNLKYSRLSIESIGKSIKFFLYRKLI